MLSGGKRKNGVIKKSDELNPLITVVTVVYNAKAALEKTMQNVFSQTYQNIEYIVIDGSSTDGTLDLIRKYEDKIDYWQSEPDKGIYDAMNKAVSLAKGDYIHFLNAADVFASNDVVEKIAQEIQNTNFVADIYFGYHIPSNKIQKKLSGLSLFLGRTICHQSVFAKKTAFENNLFDINYPIVADRKWLFVCNRHKKIFRYMHLPIVVMDQTGVSSDLNRFYKDFKKLFFEEYGFLGVIFLTVKNLPHLLMQKIRRRQKND